MKKLLSGLMATTLAASFAIADVVPLNAAPVFVPKSPEVRTDIEKVHNPGRRGWRSERRFRRWARRPAWRDDYYYDSGPFYSYRPRYYRPRYYRRHRPGVTLEFSF